MMYNIYFAGELFSFKHLLGNAVLANYIYINSNSKYNCVLPQALEQRGATPEEIKNQDLKTLFKCDFALFNLDNQPVDDGTIVEFMVAKMLDIPSILFRSDFRNGGDQETFPWNLMISNYPRTEVVITDSILETSNIKKLNYVDNDICASNQIKYLNDALSRTADKIIIGFDKLVDTPPIIPFHMSKFIYEWVSKSSGINNSISIDEINEILTNKKWL